MIFSCSTLINRALQKLKRKRRNENDYPPELVALIELLPTMRSVADELQECSDEVSRKFHLKDDDTTVGSENLSLALKLLIPKVADHQEYTKFLNSQSELYDKIGKIQRRLYAEIQDKVTNPLKTWVMSDYGRIQNSIEMLKAKRRQLDAAMAEFKKNNAKVSTNVTSTTANFKIEQCKRDYETHLSLVKADLNKIPAIQIDQATCLKNFNGLMREYHKEMSEVLKKYGAGKV